MTTTDVLPDQHFVEGDDGKYYGPYASHDEAAQFAERFACPKLRCVTNMRPVMSTQAEYERWLRKAGDQLPETRGRYAALLDAFIERIDTLTTLDEDTRETLENEVDGLEAMLERLQAAETRAVDRDASP
jgi:hypothetical protein